MRRGIIGSATLHVVVMGAAMITWPHAVKPSDEMPSIVPVDLVTIGEQTNLAPTVKEEPPPPEPEPQIEPEEIKPVAIPPEELEEPAPLKFEPEKAETPPPPPMPRPKPPPEKKFNVDNILALLDKRAPKAPPAPANARLAERTIRGIGEQNAMTMDLKDALLAQMRECWNPPVGAPDPEKLIVYVHVSLAPDGTLAQPPQLLAESQAAAASDPFTRASADAALRAIHVCVPYHMPPERYEAWSEIDMIFDPSKMLGR